MKKVILIGVPHHCNLGDHAIAIAEKKFIDKYFPEYIYNEVAEENTVKCIDKLKTVINNEDIIMIHGGGNFGNQYPLSENGRRLIIQNFPENNIILFPQTIFFDSTEEGKKELEISKKIYNNHKKLVLMAREEKSYEIMKDNFKNNKIFLTPDIVTILNECKKQNVKRNGVLIILRNDAEAKINDNEKTNLLDIIKKYYDNIIFTDTAKGGRILGHQRKDKLDELFDEYRRSELVITDRLHGMIFAAITGTPCIAISNYNHKIKYTYKWLEKFNFIRYIEDYKAFNEFENIIKDLKEIKNGEYNNEFAIDIFDKVMEAINL